MLGLATHYGSYLPCDGFVSPAHVDHVLVQNHVEAVLRKHVGFLCLISLAPELLAQ